MVIGYLDPPWFERRCAEARSSEAMRKKASIVPPHCAAALEIYKKAHLVRKKRPRGNQDVVRGFGPGNRYIRLTVHIVILPYEEEVAAYRI
jgi:hypothetical protein